MNQGKILISTKHLAYLSTSLLEAGTLGKNSMLILLHKFKDSSNQ